jgi:hypothetical protein
MATKTTKKKRTKLKKTATKRKPVKHTAKKQTAKKKPLQKKKAAPKKKLAKKKPAIRKKTAVKTRVIARKKTGAKAAAGSRRQLQDKSQSANVESFASEEVRARSAGQSGSLQGLSNSAGADSESVDELLEEGNAFEAEAVSGVEAADNADEEEVHTHEVPEDDVPGEYQDEDQ